MDKETKPVIPRVTRETRIPVNGARDILTVKDKDPNFEYRWVIDRPGRLENFRQAGYEVVTDNNEVGQKAVDSQTKLGSAITTTRGGVTLVLMRIPKEWYDEDQLAKQEKVDLQEQAMQEDLRQGGFPAAQRGGRSGERGSYTPEFGGLNLQTTVKRNRT